MTPEQRKDARVETLRLGMTHCSVGLKALNSGHTTDAQANMFLALQELLYYLIQKEEEPKS